MNSEVFREIIHERCSRGEPMLGNYFKIFVLVLLSCLIIPGLLFLEEGDKVPGYVLCGIGGLAAICCMRRMRKTMDHGHY